ncbi:hypothetical protein M422DRAFT_29237 [Sphaerobolus stellatus SS14]|uniref:Uncharacterized protein n=1 Tax=Sphaerobolus stellatus (strain SS14) TaxID=990650 RepID=A0A0C9TSC1_SPHS4|nr:hypothetical protein M422DRAFT_39014 [Sphaerobolus stellatus SS14]KIJ24774.1 hypothetical protein M422DRAFT_274369 [Sphaerobolus stellatus SS14]KIJ46369.1 hypothetical protein M422DRAFT_29237 [Sphaerobolus stellatus SS14]
MPLKEVPRRPAPTALRLYTGPTPPRSQPKHRLPSLPRPTFQPAKTMTMTDRQVGNWGIGLASISVEDLALPTSPTSRGGSLDASPTRQAPKLRGPWDQSRSLSETTLNVESLIRAPQPAAILSNSSPLPSAVW